jgi:predicted nucleic acid-binding protein
MPAVSNTSPLYYLISVGHADLLARLFDRVLIPPGVAAELSNPVRPADVRKWIANPPTWLRIQPLVRPPDSELLTVLDLGEREAIQLAIECNAEILIMDERKGRAIVQRRGLPLIGALGVLGEAHRRGTLDDPLPVLQAMRQCGFRINDELVTRFEVLLKTRYAR